MVSLALASAPHSVADDGVLGVKWATRALIHFDRVTSAWLILRFIDPEAHFVFLSEGEVAGEDTTAFGLPESAFAPHDGDSTTFQRLMEAYAIKDPALLAMGAIVAAVVEHVMHDSDLSSSARRDRHVGGVLAVAEGTMLLSATDEECLQRSLPFYDALFARMQAHVALERRTAIHDASPLQHALHIANAARALRNRGAAFSIEAFEKAIEP